MKRFVEGKDRFQSTLFPSTLDNYIAESNSVRVIEDSNRCPVRTLDHMTPSVSMDL